MKILIYLAVWKRPEITEICFMGINRLKKLGDISAFAVISERSMEPLCKAYGVDYVMYKNSPLGEKKNFGLRQALQIDFDYVVEIGSDDLLKNEFLDLYTWDRDVMGLTDLIMINSKNRQCQSINKKEAGFGLGRAMSRAAVSEDIWPDERERGLDHTSEFKMAMRGFLMKKFSSPEPVAIDIKSDQNIWAYENFIGTPYDFDKAIEGLSSDEIEAIKCLSK